MKKKDGRAVILASHGSRKKGFDAPLKRLAKRLEKEGVCAKAVCAYLELAEPSITQAAEKLIAEGHEKIFVLPYFLLPGRHLTRDIPEIVRALSRKHRSVSFRLCRYPGQHPMMLALLRDCVAR